MPCWPGRVFDKHKEKPAWNCPQVIKFLCCDALISGAFSGVMLGSALGLCLPSVSPLSTFPAMPTWNASGKRLRVPPLCPPGWVKGLGGTTRALCPARASPSLLGVAEQQFWQQRQAGSDARGV